MHIPKLLRDFSIRVHVEVVIASLPEALARGLPELILRARLAFAQQAHSDALLQNLHHHGNSIPPWFADQEMNVLGHDHESDDFKVVTLAYRFEDSEKHIAPTRGVQKRFTPITARG